MVGGTELLARYHGRCFILLFLFRLSLSPAAWPFDVCLGWGAALILLLKSCKWITSLNSRAFSASANELGLLLTQGNQRCASLSGLWWWKSPPHYSNFSPLLGACGSTTKCLGLYLSTVNVGDVFFCWPIFCLNHLGPSADYIIVLDLAIFFSQQRLQSNIPIRCV